MRRLTEWLRALAAQERAPEWVLRITVACLFLGRAWQHLRWDAPFRALLWNPKLMKDPIEQVLGLSWREFTSSAQYDDNIRLLIQSFGAWYLLCAVLALIVTTRMRWAVVAITLGALSLFFLSILYWMDGRHQFAYLIEFASQWGAPLILLAAFKWGADNRLLGFATRLAIVGTFLGHGLFALGVHPTPGSWVTMVMNSLGTSEDVSLAIIRCAGVMDVVVCVFLMIPSLRVGALIYAGAWGLLTAIARTWSHLSWDFLWPNLDQYVFETLVRIPHAGLPLWLLLVHHLAAPLANASSSATETS